MGKLFHMSQNPAARTYFPNLDASRFLAFIPVFFTHVFFSNNPEVIHSGAYLFVQNHLQLGLLGLDYFFVLSGFLITWIILEEAARRDTFSLYNFYVRRSLRIFPLYFAVVLSGFILVFLLRLLPGQSPSELPSFFYFLTFTLNFYIISHGHDFLFYLVFFWSVSVEEQFYLAWALLLTRLRKHLPLIASCCIVASLIFRWTYQDNSNQLVFNTVSCLGDFAMGALLAHFHLHHPDWTGMFRHPVMRILHPILFLVFFFLLWNYGVWFSEGIALVAERFVFGLFFLYFIALQIGIPNATFAPGKIQWLDTWGKRSFGLYCYHGVAITLYKTGIDQYFSSQQPMMCFVINPIIILVLTLFLTAFSYRYFEAPVFRFRTRYYT